MISLMSDEEYSYSFLLCPKMMTATSTEQRTESSCAFLNRPPLRLRKVTELRWESVGVRGWMKAWWAYRAPVAIVAYRLDLHVPSVSTRLAYGTWHQTHLDLPTTHDAGARRLWPGGSGRRGRPHTASLSRLSVVGADVVRSAVGGTTTRRRRGDGDSKMTMRARLYGTALAASRA